MFIESIPPGTLDVVFSDPNLPFNTPYLEVALLNTAAAWYQAPPRGGLAD
jgi:hypothetical protein